MTFASVIARDGLSAVVRTDDYLTAPRLPIHASAAHVLLCSVILLLSRFRESSVGTEEGSLDDSTRRDTTRCEELWYTFKHLNPNKEKRERERVVYTHTCSNVEKSREREREECVCVCV